jgi:Zn-dependent M28 family amino/carboxypeptidase
MQELQRHVTALAVAIGERNVWRYPALQRTVEYIEGELRKSGYSPTRQTYEVSRLPVSNVEATLASSATAGTSKASGIILVGAHYDTVTGCPGANDNGTGVAALLELARRFSKRTLDRTLRFVAFVNEEPPFFQTSQMGSAVYANAARARGDQIVGMLSLETMGYYSGERGSQQYPAEEMRSLYPDIGDFIGFVSNLESRQLLENAARAFKSHALVPVQAAALPAGLPGTGWSDHWSFWQAGYPAMMVTDTAPWRYPWYHTAEDTPDKIDFEKFGDVVDGLESVLAALASAKPSF